MKIRKMKVRDMERAYYNPRVDLAPGDTQYEHLRRSITEYGLVIPIVWNERTNRVVGGHQRLTVLENEGVTEVEVSVVNLDETEERQLNVALNKIEGGWDEEKLSRLLADMGDTAWKTGFSQAEIDQLTNNIEDLLDREKVEEELEGLEDIFNLSLTFDKADRDELQEYVKDYGKDSLVEVILDVVKEGV